MQPSERHDIILQKLAEREMMTVSELMEEFNVSIETVRRDLNHLEREKKIKKVYGGAILFNRTASITSGTFRLTENVAEKQAIGRRCAELVNDGDTVYLGPGTTVLQVAKILKERENLTVITDSIYTAMEFMDTRAEVYFIGGKINTRDAHTDLRIPENAWKNFHPAKAIVGAGGISPDYGVTDYSFSDSYGIRQMLEQALQVIVVADNSKFGLVHSYATCELENIDHVVTGSEQKDEILRDFAPYRQRFIFAEC